MLRMTSRLQRVIFKARRKMRISAVEHLRVDDFRLPFLNNKRWLLIVRVGGVGIRKAASKCRKILLEVKESSENTNTRAEQMLLNCR